MFVDRVELFVAGGNGGRGMCSFRREKYVPRGGPDGGDGGDGGSVILRADPNADNLAPLVQKKHWKAKNGEPGGTYKCAGKDAADLVILVPPGTLVKDRDRGNVLKDLVDPGDELVIPGGRGGRGNCHFASATNRTPREFEPGEEGEERWITLELKMIADAGLVGFPNAGKSTLLSRLSRATPEIADYPFTTKHPNLGIVSLGQDAAFVMADLPGLIEGASQGIGLGHEFLRHVDRTRVLIHLVEPFPTDGTDAVKNYHTIRNELKTYSMELAAKPEIVCVSKAELTDAATVRDALAAELGREVLLISSVTGEGLSKLVGKAAELITEQRKLDREAKEKTKTVVFATEKAIRETEGTEAATVTPDIVVDIGNSRMKWGLCAPDVVEMVSLPLDDLNAWDDQAERWRTEGPTHWAVGGVNPKRTDEFLKWRKARGGNCVHFTRYDQLPITLKVDNPETVGLDRLFGAVAANARRRPGCAAVTVDVGTAVTVNVLDLDGVFRGGCIFPGFRLMAKSLHDHTAKLPEVDTSVSVTFPGTNTEAAIQAGIRCTVSGGVLAACAEVAKQFGPPERIDAFVTGGGSSPELLAAPGWTFQHVPTLNLEGIRLAATK